MLTNRQITIFYQRNVNGEGENININRDEGVIYVVFWKP